MRHARRRIVQRGARIAAVGGLLCGGLMVTHAMASEPSATSRAGESSTQAAADRGAQLVSTLGTSRTAGSWIAADGQPVVAVTDTGAAAEVKQAGARPKVVDHSMQDLKSATETLSSAPRVTGTAWAVDYKNNEVVVRADSTVSASDWSRMTTLAEGIGDSVRMERTEGTFTTRLNGADALLSTGGRCSAGFNVTAPQGQFILTAGHCGPAGSVWFADEQGTQQVGRTITTSFPGDDYSLVQYDTGKAPGDNIVAIGGGQGVRITGVADPTVGQRVFRSGSTSGLRDGQVTALNATVNYPEGTVSGLIETTVCAEPGDSGGPLFSEGIALGVTSGGNGDCTSGGTTFFQPVTTALAELGVTLVGQPQASSSPTGQASAAPSAAASQGAAVAPGSAAPGAVESVDIPGTAGTLIARLTDPRNVGPGLLVIAGSIIALVATRYIRTEQDRNRYRRQYSQSWG
ncbi:S1 family peptidase [Streptomyces sp. NPDC058256]|uniref:S1 family peptidase n=1 Tax=unclassified Streptomyces TaxID=2593676 RepID=UPI0036DFE1D3